MSDPKNEGKQIDQPGRNNVDSLLSEVKQMADRVGNLIGTIENPPSKKSENPPEPKQVDPSQLDQAANLLEMDRLAQDNAQRVSEAMQQDSNPAEESAELPAPQSGDSPQEIKVDQHTEKEADEEIDQALHRLKIDDIITSSRTGEQKKESPEIAETLIFPKPIKSFLFVLMLINQPFQWIPRPARDIMGYSGVATLMIILFFWLVLGRE